MPELVALIPETRLALTVQLWIPDATDLDPPKYKDRVRFERVTRGEPGEVLFVRLPSVPLARAPVILQFRADEGEGRYKVVALGPGSGSGTTVMALMEELDRDGRDAQALALAAGFSRKLPESASHSDVLVAAGKLAARLAGELKHEETARFTEAARLLGEPIFERFGAGVRYTGAFEAASAGHGGLAQDADFRLIATGNPCSAPEVARRATAFMERHPESNLVPLARLWLARALEDEYFHAGKHAKKPQLDRVLEIYRILAKGKGELAAEARQRLKALGAKKLVRPKTPRVVCTAGRR